ncbi:MAG TPA: hypothetical protein VFN46_04870, partial [Acetobacteraceae bacterium]|nr:hypothetical protein [Acetobacteraceae bacterium]
MGEGARRQRGIFVKTVDRRLQRLPPAIGGDQEPGLVRADRGAEGVRGRGEGGGADDRRLEIL